MVGVLRSALFGGGRRAADPDTDAHADAHLLAHLDSDTDPNTYSDGDYDAHADAFGDAFRRALFDPDANGDGRRVARADAAAGDADDVRDGGEAGRVGHVPDRLQLPARLAANLRGRLLRHLRSAWDRSLGPSVGTMK